MDEGYNRTFTGDPNPPPKPPTAPAVSSTTTTSAPAAESGSSSAAAQPATVQQSEPAGDLYRVQADGDGRQSVYVMDSNLETKKLGAVTLSGADDVLHQLGQYNEATGSWTVPKDAAMQLIEGRLPLPEYLKAKWVGGEAGAVRGMLGLKAFNGEMPDEEARARGKEELLKVQLNEAPVFAWQGGGFGPNVAKIWEDLKNAGPSGIARRVAGELAANAPDLGRMFAEGVGYAGAAAGAVATVGGGVGEVPAIPAIIAAGQLGFDYGIFKHVLDSSTGNTYLDMQDKGFEPATAKKMAPLAGAINGILMVGQVKFMTASLQRTFVGKVLESATVKGALARYVTEVSAGTSLAVAQKAVDMIVNDIGAQMDARPDLTTQHPVSDLVNAAVTAGPVMAILGLPGAALEVAHARADTAAEVKAKAEVDTRLKERDAALAKEKVPTTEVPAPQAETPGQGPASPEAVKPAATADTTGDYFTSPAEKAVHESVGQYEQGKTTAEDVVGKVDAAVEEITARKEPSSYGQKISEQEVKAASRQLESDLGDTRVLIKELTQARDRFERGGKSTRLLDKKLSDLLDKEQEIKNGLTFYEAAKGKDVGVTPNEKLLMKPATLESIANLGLVEGRKEVLDVRRQKILDVANKLELTQADMRLLLKDKNYGTMSDAEFSHWLEKGATKDGEHVPSFKERATELAKRKVALEELRTVKKDRALKGEQHIRQLNELPPVAKMTRDQIHDYADILREYDRGDEALTPARVKALETTELKGAKTKGEVRARVAELMDRPEEAFKTVKVLERDKFTPDPQLARKDPWRSYTVSRVKEFQIRSELTAHEVMDHFHELAAKAQSERRAQMSLGQRVADWLVPQQKELMAYIEQATKDTSGHYDVPTPDLTPSERAYADEWLKFSKPALGYLVQVKALESSRFVENYLPHIHRGLLEMVKDLPSTGFKSAVKELYARLETPAGMPADEVARALGMRKAFNYAEFRTGELKPSTNVFAVVDHYVKMFYNKVALDEAVPFINTVVKAFEAAAKSPEDEALFKSISAFTDLYLEAKKGDARWMWDKGGHIESGIRFGMSLVALKHIALNLALHAMSPIGEATGDFMALGNRGVVKARARRLTADGKAILEKYSAFVGEGPLEQLHPGSDVGDVAKAVMYGTFKAIRKNVMKDILLGSLTPEELKAQTVSADRLAQIKLEAGRWIDVHGNKSIRGASVMGSQWTQFKGWVIPPTLSIAEDVAALGKRIAGDKTALKPEHVRDFYHLAQLGTAAVLFRSWATAEMEDDSFMGRAIHYARGEVLSMFSGPKSMLGMVAGGVLTTEVAKFFNNLMMLATLETYQRGEKEGQNKGFDALVKQFTPAAAKQFQSKEK